MTQALTLVLTQVLILGQMIATFSNGDKEHATININLSNKPIWISDLNVDRKVPILEFIKDGEIKVWLKSTTTIP